MAYGGCPYHSNLSPRWGYFLYQDFHGPQSDLSMPTKLTDHAVIRGGNWKEDPGHTTAPSLALPTHYDGHGWVVRASDGVNAVNDAKSWVRGLADGVLEVDVRGEGGLLPNCGLLFRLKEGAASCLAVYIHKHGFGATTLRLSRIPGWFQPPVDVQSVNLTPAPTTNVNYHLEVSFHGPHIKASINGVQKISAVEYFNVAERHVGLYLHVVYGGVNQAMWTQFRLRR